MESRKRTIAKTLSWRSFSLIVTSIIVWRVTGEYKLGVAIALLDCIIKMVAYYVHERAWTGVSFGYAPLSTRLVAAEINKDELERESQSIFVRTPSATKSS